jgi:hypothetical protein
MIPDFINWCSDRRARRRVHETRRRPQFCHPTTRNWSSGLLNALDLPERILPPILPPAHALGNRRASVVQRTWHSRRGGDRAGDARHRLRGRRRADDRTGRADVGVFEFGNVVAAGR